MSKITFDYSKASGFIQDHEVESMKKITSDAKELLLSRKMRLPLEGFYSARRTPPVGVCSQN